MNRRNRINLALTAIILVILLAAWGYRALRGSSAPELSTAPVERADLEETITAQGKLEPKEYVIVGAQVSGQLSKLHVAIGDRVETGQLIAEIDPRILEARVAADRARLAALEAQLAEQRAQITYAAQVLARNRELIGLREVRQEPLDESESTPVVARAPATTFTAPTANATHT